MNIHDKSLEVWVEDTFTGRRVCGKEYSLAELGWVKGEKVHASSLGDVLCTTAYYVRDERFVPKWTDVYNLELDK